MVDVTFRYNTNLANYKGIAPGKLAVDAGTLITLAQADLSGAQLDLLFRSGRDVVITSTIRTEATFRDLPDATTIVNWITRNGNNPHLIIDNNPLNPEYVRGSDNGEISIIGYVQRTGGDIRVVTEDLKWMEGLRTGLAAARDLAGTSGVNLTTNEFVNDLMISGSITPYEHSLAAFQILKIDPLRNNPEQQNLLFRPGDAIPIEFQNGTTGHVFYAGPLGAIAVDEHGVLIGVPAIFGLRLNIPKSSPLKFTEADHSADTASLAYGPIEDINGKLAIVGEDTDHSSLLQHARFEYDPNEGTMSRSLVKDDGTSTQSVFDTGTKPWSSETSEFNVYQRLQSQRVDFDNGSQQIKKYDPDDNHPYKQLDITKGPNGQISEAQLQLEANIIAAGGSVGQIFGSALGRALAPNNQFAQLAVGTVAGLIGQKLLQTFTASLTLDASRFIAGNFASVTGLEVANAGLGAISSFLAAELGHELGLTGFGAELFNAGVGGVTGSVLTQVATKVAAGYSFDAAIGLINWSTAATQAGYNISSAAGSFLAHQFVHPESHEGAVGGQLLGAVGSALGLSAVLNATITGFMGFLIPGLGSLFGTIIGTMLGDAIAGVRPIRRPTMMCGFSAPTSTSPTGWSAPTITAMPRSRRRWAIRSSRSPTAISTPCMARGSPSAAR